MNKGTQGGATLFVALIVLVVITLLAMSSLTTTNMNLKVVGNMQSRSEALHAAQQAIETVISTPRFIFSPADAVPMPCGAANTLCTDLNGDGTPEYITRLDPAPTCVTMKVIKASELNLASADDLGCAAGQTQPIGVASGDSLCADTAWDITAETHSTFSRTKVTITQGVVVRVSAVDAKALCEGNGADVRQFGSIQRSRGDPLPTSAQGGHPEIMLKRLRTYWYTHGDQ